MKVSRFRMVATRLESLCPSREAGLAKLSQFLPRAAHHYGTYRNFDEGPRQRQHVSELSPWISRRLITEAEVIGRVLAMHGETESGCHPFLREVLWRGYWRSYLEQRPSIWTSYRQMLAENPPFNDPAYDQVTQAQSGIDVFDHWAKELKAEGYLHNHARLWLSSLWIHTLKLPWQWGAAWFLEHLLDGDAASNTLSWRWVAGLHTKGKAYLATADNIAKFTDQRLNPILPAASVSGIAENLDHPLIDPQLAPSLHECSIETNDGLILLGDDLSLETLKGLSSRPIKAVALVPAEKIGTFFAWQDKVRHFHTQAIEDALYRAKKIWPMADCQVLPIDDYGSARLFLRWNSKGIKRILVPTPHQGPYREMWESLAPSLSQFQIVAFNRHYDLELLPLGKKGFFDFWQRRPPWHRLCQEEIFHQG